MFWINCKATELINGVLLQGKLITVMGMDNVTFLFEKFFDTQYDRTKNINKL
jgi:hypothetical protein